MVLYRYSGDSIRKCEASPLYGEFYMLIEEFLSTILIMHPSAFDDQISDRPDRTIYSCYGGLSQADSVSKSYPYIIASIFLPG